MTACDENSHSETHQISPDTDLRIGFYVWQASTSSTCHCYAWPIDSIDSIDSQNRQSLHPDFVPFSNYNCEANNFYVCYQLNYTVCSLENECSSVEQTNIEDGESMGSFNTSGMNIASVWFHRVVMEYRADTNFVGRTIGFVYISGKYQ